MICEDMRDKLFKITSDNTNSHKQYVHTPEHSFHADNWIWMHDKHIKHDLFWFFHENEKQINVLY